jgi:hypothetical protein
MTPITTIVHFTVPVANVEKFLAFWQGTVRDEMRRRPGLIDGILHRGVDADGPFQFINVARWHNAEALRAGLRDTAQALLTDGIDLGAVLRDLDVTVSQNNYVEEVRYTADAKA